MDRIAWSRSGFVAYIADGDVFITWLKCVDGEAWSFVPAVSVPISSDSEPLHLSWSASNYDLAIVDTLGRIQISTILSDAQVTNHISASLASDSRPRPSELDAVVGMRWLGLEKNQIIPRGSDPDTEVLEKEHRAWDSVPPLGPFHPIKGKGALVCVSGNGMLRLLVQAPDQRYTEVDAVMPGAKCITNVAFCPNGSSMLIATYSVEQGLLIYDALFTWRLENFQPGQNKRDVVDVRITPVANGQLMNGPQPRLTALAMYHPIVKGNVRGDIELRVVCPSPPGAREETSIVERYTLRLRESPLHPAFFELLATTTPAPPAPQSSWHLVSLGEVEDDAVRMILVDDLVLMTIYESGRVKSERLVASEKVNFDNCGLTFDPAAIRTASAICVSPNNTYIALYPAGETETYDKINAPAKKASDSNANVKSTKGQEEMPILICLRNSEEELSSQTVVSMAASLATRYAYTVFNSVQCDDMLGVCWTLLHRDIAKKGADPAKFFDVVTAETQRLLNVTFLGPGENRQLDRLIVIPSPLQRWLSLNMVLGTTMGWKRSPACIVCLGVLNLQILAFSLTWTIKKISQKSHAQTPDQLQNELSSHCYHISNMFGLLRWLSDLIARTGQEVYLASVNEEAAAGSGAEMLVKTPNVMSSLLLSSVSRFLLRFAIKSTRTLTQAVLALGQAEARVGGSIVAQTQRRLIDTLQTGPVPLDQFDKFLIQVDEHIGQILRHSGCSSDKERQALDAELLKTALCPQVLQPTAEQVIKAFTVNIKVDMVKLYYRDTAWLQLDQDPTTSFSYDEHPEGIDIIRKRVVLASNTKQQCTRCGMLSIVDTPRLHGVAQWTLLFQRYCLCGGSWLTLNKKTV